MSSAIGAGVTAGRAPIVSSFCAAAWQSLRDSLAEIGGRLVIRRGAPVKELERLALETKAKAIFFNRDPDPYGRKVEGELTSRPADGDQDRRLQRRLYSRRK